MCSNSDHFACEDFPDVILHFDSAVHFAHVEMIVIYSYFYFLKIDVKLVQMQGCDFQIADSFSLYNMLQKERKKATHKHEVRR